MAKYTSKPAAKVLEDSMSPAGHRLTTMEVTFHRFVLSEFNTHRVFSRNSASSRAIPGRLQRERVLETPAMPVTWPSKARGMQGGEELPPELQSKAETDWKAAAKCAVQFAADLDELGVHKSVTNRLLEPFLMHTVIVTSTEWENFFGLRDNELAQPEIHVAAALMREVYDASTPLELEYGEWHLPLTFVDNDDTNAIYRYAHDHAKGWEDVAKKVSAARCARVSYLTHSGERSIDKDIELYERLTSADPPHASPLEHVATPCKEDPHVIMGPTARGPGVKAYESHRGNFTGWDQLRHVSGVLT